MTETPDLHALLGDRYDETVAKACLAAAYGWHDATCPESRDCPSRDMHSASAPAVLAGIVGASALAALAAVLPDLLVRAWDEGAADACADPYHPYGECEPPHVNPYRTTEGDMP